MLRCNQPGPDAGKPQDALVLTPYEKVTATAQGSFWIGLTALGAIGVYFVGRELLPKYVVALISERMVAIALN